MALARGAPMLRCCWAFTAASWGVMRRCTVGGCGKARGADAAAAGADGEQVKVIGGGTIGAGSVAGALRPHLHTCTACCSPASNISICRPVSITGAEQGALAGAPGEGISLAWELEACRCGKALSCHAGADG